MDTDISQLAIGTDDKQAIRKAIREVLPSVTNILCFRHLKNNLTRYLQKNVGLIESERRRVVQDIFGVNGVITVTDERLFNARLNDITTRVNTASGNTKFSKYIDNATPCATVLLCPL